MGSSPSNKSNPGPQNNADHKIDNRRKAEEIAREISRLPRISKTTDGKSSEEFINDIMEHERIHHGIDWKRARDGGENEIMNALHKTYSHLHIMKSKLSKKEVENTKSSGLLDEDGRIKQADLLPDLESDLLEIAPKATDAAT